MSSQPTKQPFQLRPYQTEAISAVITARRRGLHRMVIALPTGAGKTVIFSELARLAKRPVLVLAHRTELVQQAAEKLGRSIGDPSLVAVEQGAVTAAKGVKVVVASIRSLNEKRLHKLINNYDFGLIVYDECHHSAAEDNMRVLRSLGCFRVDWSGTLLGFTATTVRADGLGLDTVFEEVIYNQGLMQMIRDGFLSPLRGFRIATAADLTGVAPAGGDLNIEQLAEAVDITDRNALVARSIQELARDRRTIAFCVTVAHAKNLARSLNALGVPAGVVYGNLKTEDRVAVLERFRSGRIQVLANVGVLTEGFDDPGVSCIAMARPTRSEGLYTQCVGRGTRLFNGKKDCLVLDFVDLSDLSLMALPTLGGIPKDIDLEGEDLAEACERFHQLMFDYPGFELEAGAITLGEIQERAAAFDPLSMEIDPEVFAISPNAWESLGSRGVALHFFQKKGDVARGKLSIFEILRKGRGASKWHILLNGKKVAGFSKVEAAVEATDFEVAKLGRFAGQSAHSSARWRSEPVPHQLRNQLENSRISVPVENWGDAVRVLGVVEG
jgi:ATP-dependent helicase IRC3